MIDNLNKARATSCLLLPCVLMYSAMWQLVALYCLKLLQMSTFVTRMTFSRAHTSSKAAVNVTKVLLLNTNWVIPYTIGWTTGRAFSL